MFFFVQVCEFCAPQSHTNKGLPGKDYKEQYTNDLLFSILENKNGSHFFPE